MISENVQVIPAVDPTMQGNDGTEKIPRYGRPITHHCSASVFHCGRKTVTVVSFPELPPHINSHCSWEKRTTVLIGEYRLLPLVCRPALMISTPLQPFLNINRGISSFMMAGLPRSRYPALLSLRRTVLVESGLFSC